MIQSRNVEKTKWNNGDFIDVPSLTMLLEPSLWPYPTEKMKVAI